jgi:hypothetical protein
MAVSAKPEMLNVDVVPIPLRGADDPAIAKIM